MWLRLRLRVLVARLHGGWPPSLRRPHTKHDPVGEGVSATPPGAITAAAKCAVLAVLVVSSRAMRALWVLRLGLPVGPPAGGKSESESFCSSKAFASGLAVLKVSTVLCRERHSPSETPPPTDREASARGMRTSKLQLHVAPHRCSGFYSIDRLQPQRVRL